jgi:oligosaccharyltransferase complex subunit gamma
MLLLPFLALFSFAFTRAAADDDTHKKLVALAAAGGGLIKLDAASYDLLTAPNRDWSASIEFTALDARRRCAPCKPVPHSDSFSRSDRFHREFSPSWNIVAKSWSKTPQVHRDSHFFATLDFDDGQTVFQKLGLASAPVVYVYPATEGPRATGKSGPSKYDFSQ